MIRRLREAFVLAVWGIQAVVIGVVLAVAFVWLVAGVVVLGMLAASMLSRGLPW